MSVKECAVCAWRAGCNLKFDYQGSELHCREYTRDVLLPETVKKPEDETGEKHGVENDKKAE